MYKKQFKRSVVNPANDEQLLLDIDALNKSYHYHKHVLYEDENGLSHYDPEKLFYSRRTVLRVESILDMMPRRERLIIEAEVIGSKKGTKWYIGFFSAPSYYRIRRQAYKMFLDLVNK